jgi:3-oxoacyl-[acyl-carrier-protein] synthase I
VGARGGTGIAVTALAAGNALGATTREVLGGLAAGRTGLAPARLDLPFETVCGVYPQELSALPGPLAAYDSGVARVALAVLKDIEDPVRRAAQRWGPERVGIVVGTSTGGIRESERAFAHWTRAGSLPASFALARQHAYHALLDVLRLHTGLAGPGAVLSTACSSSAAVFGSARRLIRSGVLDAVLVGGVDTLCDITLRGFRALSALSAAPCRPFAVGRDGISIGEGGAFLLLERDGDALARLLGVGESCDAHHMSHPHPEGVGARMAMRAALAEAGLATVDHVNAHGTGTPANDAVEGAAIAAVVGPDVPVASTKGYTGHLLGAAGATEAVFAIEAIRTGQVPASLGSAPVDPAISIRVAQVAERRPIRTVLSNSFAFGGNNVSLLFGGAA